MNCLRLKEKCLEKMKGILISTTTSSKNAIKKSNLTQIALIDHKSRNSR